MGSASLLRTATAPPAIVLALAVSPLAGCDADARDVALLDLSGAVVRPLEAIQGKALVVVFVSIDCPISNRYLPEIRELAAGLGPKGIDFRLAYADPSHEAPAIRRHLAEYAIDLPALRDAEHSLARFCGARATPEAAVFLPGGVLAYRGRIDDRFVTYGQAKPAPARRDLALALEQILAGRVVEEPRTEAVGCPIAELDP